MTTHTQTFQQYALPYMKDMYAVAMKYTRNRADADDLVQETLLKALLAWDSFTAGTNCRAWLLRILTNNFINNYRRHRRKRQHDQLQAAAPMETATFDIADTHLSDEVSGALSALPKDFQRVVILADVMDMTYREISKELHCPAGTVMSRLFRGRRILETSLHDYARHHRYVPPTTAPQPATLPAAA